LKEFCGTGCREEVYRLLRFQFRKNNEQLQQNKGRRSGPHIRVCNNLKREGGRVGFNVVVTANTREDLIGNADRRVLGWNERTDLSHDLGQRDLTEICRLATLTRKHYFQAQTAQPDDQLLVFVHFTFVPLQYACTLQIVFYHSIIATSAVAKSKTGATMQVVYRARQKEAP